MPRTYLAVSGSPPGQPLVCSRTAVARLGTATSSVSTLNSAMLWRLGEVSVRSMSQARPVNGTGSARRQGSLPGTGRAARDSRRFRPRPGTGHPLPGGSATSRPGSARPDATDRRTSACRSWHCHQPNRNRTSWQGADLERRGSRWRGPRTLRLWGGPARPRAARPRDRGGVPHRGQARRRSTRSRPACPQPSR